MKKFYILGALVACGLSYYAGRVAGRLASNDPTPEQCLSVCVEEFERMGC